VLELGAGTGRVTRLLAPHVQKIFALDNSLPMLQVAHQSLNCAGNYNTWLAVADHRHLPVKSAMADLVISGWSICYLVNPGLKEPYPDWQESLSKAISEMERILQPNGAIMIIETLGTGFESPHPPDHLVDYYEWLAGRGFSSTWVRTDYRFHSLEEAIDLTRFFFGKALAQEVIEKEWIILPECTGIWWKKICYSTGAGSNVFI